MDGSKLHNTETVFKLLLDHVTYLMIQRRNGGENVVEKVNLRIFNLQSDYSNSNFPEVEFLRTYWLLYSMNPLFVTLCWCKTSWKALLRVLPPSFKSVNNQICCKRGLMWMVKRTTSLFNSFCSNVAKRVARFLLPVLSLPLVPYVTDHIYFALFSLVVYVLSATKSLTSSGWLVGKCSATIGLSLYSCFWLRPS